MTVGTPQFSGQPLKGALPPDDPPCPEDSLHSQVAAGHEHLTAYVVPSLHDSLTPMLHEPLPPFPPAPVCVQVGLGEMPSSKTPGESAGESKVDGLSDAVAPPPSLLPREPPSVSLPATCPPQASAATAASNRGTLVAGFIARNGSTRRYEVGCGGQIDCGTCTPPETCGGGRFGRCG